MLCSCCGEGRAGLTALNCRSDVLVCRDCIRWLASASGMLDVTPRFPVVDMDAAAKFYEAVGGRVRRYDDGFAFVTYGDDSLCDLSLVDSIDVARNGAGCYVTVRAVEEWHARFVAAGHPVTSLADQPWGMREFSAHDPSGNEIRIGQPSV